MLRSGEFTDNVGFTSDLACERRRADTDISGVDFKKECFGEYCWERIRITSEEGAKSIGRPCGIYNTLTLPRVDTLDEEDTFDASNEIAKELCHIFDDISVYPGRLLVVGLGNPALTPDSVGPKCAERINATMHISRFKRGVFGELECSEIAVCTPGVMASTGIEAAETVLGLCDRISPDAVIAIDSLAARSPERLGKTIQISDTGIFPGSGIGNARFPLSKRTLGIPVIAIGVPTVINASVLASRDEEGYDDSARRKTHDFDEMFVSPREIDGIAHTSAKIIAQGINQAFGIV